MSLAELFAKIPPQKQKDKVRVLKEFRKERLIMSKFARRPGCYVVSTGNTKCLDCGLVNFAHRLGCTVCRLEAMEKGVQHGALINTGKLNTKDRFKPLMAQTEFIPYSALYKRLIAGERFYDTSHKTELTLKHFER
jgi:hypothetical protein